MIAAAFKLRARLLAWALSILPIAAVSLVLFILSVVSTVLIVVWVGMPILLAVTYAAQLLAQYHRRWLPRIDGKGRLESPYLRPESGNVLARFRMVFVDPARRRDLLWLFLNGTFGLVLSILAVIESVLGLVFWFLPPGLAVRVHAALARALLAPSAKSRLAQRVQQLAASRAETVDTQSAELRRIERDLHDGAQARLVALGMNLALAEQALARDPDAARALLREAQTAGSDALAELRDLVRGIHPPVLADRGLVGAVQALALASPLPVAVEAEVAGRLPAPVESAAYFAVAEALTNVIKHAHARSVWISLRHAGDLLTARIRDDGIGGAEPGSGGTGLRGIERRLAAFDGNLAVKSPPGGGTELTMVLPCPSVSSSPKTLPSSGTV